ncbi:nuclear inhibitor of protein phosphatase 1 [Chrysoperla carnea]|uniref:nuclear inhibitor of protein phosphatase 1 n=1 Tax=Chrysoperla carnea TaxID=189513 RepID=UPI001D08E733|nr:nuclear inhibitor of protein phosphatase 1 [Chrysoperla carnea]
MANHYEVPNWAGKPPIGLHLDVLKGDKLIQKLMIDQKKCYLFGRNAQLNDFCIDHASCSRVHAAFVYHKHLNRAFLIDLGSTHGTFIGPLRLEPYKPTQLATDSTFHFGASTRNYVLRERPQAGSRPIIDELETETNEDGEGGLLGLPENELELDNLTEFNTAHNRRISMLGITDDSEKRTNSRKRKRRGVSFNEDEEIINLEDIDPTIGRFRNLVQTTIIPSTQKRPKLAMDLSLSSSSTDIGLAKNLHPNISHLYHDIPPETHSGGPISPSSLTSSSMFSNFNNLSARLGMSLPNPAPEVDMMETQPIPSNSQSFNNAMPSNNQNISDSGQTQEPKKKKYAKEAWPGKKPVPGLF